ncbi:TolB-like translocation protein [Algoriphagus mannitolivorans]|uniref:hypothetical protein n=1 Tax=Algoriphagus mannitolivorans TaxID=226504 RepID=UPI000421F23A|nr:hypothetical protein [Algoriphagus mannitolivorans]
MRKITLIHLILFFLIASSTLAQGSFDLWVVDTQGKGGKLELIHQSAKTLTNRAEYDNQPNFINDSELVFSAADNKGNHDIILYSFRTGNFTNFSKTADRSEYSPALTDCKQYISAVVVEPDGSQRLWLYPVTGEPAELLYDDIAPVGYYDWYDNKAAMFVLGEPNKLIYAHGKGNLEEICSWVGRSVKNRPKSAEISYLDLNDQKSVDNKNSISISSYDIKKKTYKDYGYTLPDSQDFIWVDKNHLLMASGEEIFIRKGTESVWKSLGKIPSSTHQKITRMAYSPDLNKLVFVMQRNQP